MSALSACSATFRKRSRILRLINTAYNVGHAAKPCEQRSGHKRIGARSKRSRPVARTGGTIVGGGNARKTH